LSTGTSVKETILSVLGDENGEDCSEILETDSESEGEISDTMENSDEDKKISFASNCFVLYVSLILVKGKKSKKRSDSEEENLVYGNEESEGEEEEVEYISSEDSENDDFLDYLTSDDSDGESSSSEEGEEYSEKSLEGEIFSSSESEETFKSMVTGVFFLS
jgi:hypothetical protein